MWVFIGIFALGTWGNEAKASYDGTVTFPVVNLPDISSDLETIDWTATIPAGSSLSVDFRAGNVEIPDGTWTAWTAVNDGGSLSAFNGSQYYQYRVSMSSADDINIPNLSDIKVGHYKDDILISSPYNVEDKIASLEGIHWTENLIGATEVKFQIRTSGDGSSWSDWCGPDNGGVDCDTTSYFNDPSGGEAVDAMFQDNSNDQYLQYKVFLRPDGTNVPVVSAMEVDYVVDYTVTREFAGTVVFPVGSKTVATDNFETISWAATVPASSSLSVEFRAGNVSTPDVTWTEWTAVNTGDSLSTFDGNQYYQYQILMSVSAGATEVPSVDDIAVSFFANNNLISSPYDTTDDNIALKGLIWNETLLGSSDAKFQIRTSPDGATWTDWLGPTGTVDYYSDFAGAETLNPVHSSNSDDRYVQYKMFLLGGSGGAPTVSQVELNYDFDNSAPTIESITSATSNGEYKEADEINITLNFDELVTSATGLSVTLDTGGVVTIPLWATAVTSVSGTYTVGATHISSGLNVTGITGTIIDVSTNETSDAAYSNETLNPVTPTGSNLADNKDLVVDNQIPSSSITIPDGITPEYSQIPVITGTASDDHNLDTIYVSIKDTVASKYWDGNSWEDAQTWLAGTGTTSWSYDSSGVTWVPNNEYLIQSKAVDLAGNEGTPAVGKSFTFVNSAPVVTINSVTKNSTVNINYDVADSESDSTTVSLVYDSEATLSSDIDSSSTTAIEVSDITRFPTSGTILLQHGTGDTTRYEYIAYTGTSGNTLTGITRGALSTLGYSHSTGALVKIKATTVSGDVGTVADGTGKTMVWTAETDINFYEAT